jgi:hypothetical protein
MSELFVIATAAVVGAILIVAGAREVSLWQDRAAWVKPPHPSEGSHPYRRKQEGGFKVTPVAGTILMVGITVVLAAVLYVMVTSL